MVLARPIAWLLVFVLLAFAVAGARADTGAAKGLLRVTATWGDDRFLGGYTQTALSRDGRRFAVSAQGGAIIWDLAGGAEVHIPMPASRWQDTRLAFGAGDRVLVTARGNDLAVWDAATGRKLAGVKPPGFERPDVALAPGTSLAALWQSYRSSNYHLEIWDIEKGTRVQQIAEEPLAGGAGSVTFTGDGRRLFVRQPIATNRSDRLAEKQGLWNVADGKIVYKDTTTGWCSDNACTPVTATLLADGRTLVRTFDRPSASAAGGEPWLPQRWIELVDLDTDRTTVLERSPFEIQFSVSDDERTLACTTSAPDQIAIWDLGRRVRKVLKIADHGVSRVRLSAHEKLLLLGGNVSRDDGWLSIYRTADGRRLSEIPHVPRRNGYDGSYDLDDTAGLLLCLTGCGQATERSVAWDVASGKPAFDLPGAGNRAWFSTKRGPLIQMWYGGFDLRAAAAPWPSLLPAPRHIAPVFHVSLSRDGKSLAEASGDGTLLIRDVANPSRVVALPVQGPALDVAFLPDRDLLAVAYAGRAALWDPAKLEVVAEAKAGKAGATGRLLAAGHRVAFETDRRGIEIRSLDDGRVIETMAHPCGPRTPGLAAVDFTGAGVCAVAEEDQSGALRALRTGAVRARLGKKQSSVLAVSLSGDGTRALVSHYEGGALLLSIGGEARVRPLPGTAAETPVLAFTPDGRRALTGSADGVLRLWDAASGALLDSFSMAERIDRPTAIGFAPDGRTLFVGTARGLVHRIEVAAP
jgi:WD40 repeat protein